MSRQVKSVQSSINHDYLLCFKCFNSDFAPKNQVVTPTGNVLVDDLTLKVEPGSNLLITGSQLNSLLDVILLCISSVKKVVVKYYL